MTKDQLIRKIMTKVRQMTKPQLKRFLAKLNRMNPKIEGFPGNPLKGMRNLFKGTGKPYKNRLPLNEIISRIRKLIKRNSNNQNETTPFLPNGTRLSNNNTLITKIRDLREKLNNIYKDFRSVRSSSTNYTIENLKLIEERLASLLQDEFINGNIPGPQNINKQTYWDGVSLASLYRDASDFSSELLRTINKKEEQNNQKHSKKIT